MVYKEEDIHIPMWIKDEAPKPMEIVAIHEALTSDMDVAPILEGK